LKKLHPDYFIPGRFNAKGFNTPTSKKSRLDSGLSVEEVTLYCPLFCEKNVYRNPRFVVVTLSFSEK